MQILACSSLHEKIFHQRNVFLEKVQYCQLNNLACLRQRILQKALQSVQTRVASSISCLSIRLLLCHGSGCNPLQSGRKNKKACSNISLCFQCLFSLWTGLCVQPCAQQTCKHEKKTIPWMRLPG